MADLDSPICTARLRLFLAAGQGRAAAALVVRDCATTHGVGVSFEGDDPCTMSFDLRGDRVHVDAAAEAITEWWVARRRRF